MKHLLKFAMQRGSFSIFPSKMKSRGFGNGVPFIEVMGILDKLKGLKI